jgi:hypothetical protein
VTAWTLRDLLLTGRPEELVPESLPFGERAARRYAADPRLSREERERIRRVWLCGLDPDHAEPEAEQVAAEWSL